jgi:hypothetical protein
LDTPAAVIDALTGMLRRYRRRIGSRWRGYDTGLQAVLTCAWLEGGHTYQQLADGNAIPRETCRRYIQEGIKVLARRALPLTEVVRLAVKAGWPYLIVDGVNIPTERVAAKFTAKQHWYSGKHHVIMVGWSPAGYARVSPWPLRASTTAVWAVRCCKDSLCGNGFRRSGRRGHRR